MPDHPTVVSTAPTSTGPVAVAALVMLLLGLFGGVPGATASDGPGAYHGLIDDIRVERGLVALTRRADLDDVAKDSAGASASSGQLAHHPDLTGAVQGWSAVGEVVGKGSGAAGTVGAWMDSPSHRDTILGAFTEIGVGVVVDERGISWVSVVFRQPEGIPGSASRSTTTTTDPSPDRSTPSFTTAVPGPSPDAITPASTTHTPSARMAAAIAATRG